MQLSLVIPAYTVSPELKEVLLRAIHSLEGQVDEIVVSEDSDIHDPDVAAAVDVYDVHARKGYTSNSNYGWQLAKGDYVLHMNSDAYWLSGDPRILCMPNTITSPRCREDEWQGWGPVLNGACFMVPREVSDKFGMFDTHWEHRNAPDRSMFDMYKRNGVEVVLAPPCWVSHASGSPSIRAIGGSF
jgi:glycosyltransferase involved in cell wall biosynthesis